MKSMTSGRSEQAGWMIIRSIRYVGVIAGVLTFLLITGSQEVFAQPRPNVDDDEHVKEAVEEFDEAQNQAAGAVPKNKTSKALEDKLDKAARKKDDVDDDPKSTKKQKKAAKDAKDKAKKSADDFNAGTKDPDVAETYREKLEKRREARKKLKKQKRRWIKAKFAPRGAARALRLIDPRLELADEPPTWIDYSGLVPSDQDHNAVALLEGGEERALAAGGAGSPTLGAVRSIRADLAGERQAAVYVPYDTGQEGFDAAPGRAADSMLSGLVAQRAHRQRQAAHRADDRDRYREGKSPEQESSERSHEQEVHSKNESMTDLKAPTRNRYFSGSLLTARDLQKEQSYFRAKLRMHNRALHGRGVVCGLGGSCAGSEDHIYVEPGMAIDGRGREIVIPERWTINYKPMSMESGPWAIAMDRELSPIPHTMILKLWLPTFLIMIHVRFPTGFRVMLFTWIRLWAGWV